MYPGRHAQPHMYIVYPNAPRPACTPAYVCHNATMPWPACTPASAYDNALACMHSCICLPQFPNVPWPACTLASVHDHTTMRPSLPHLHLCTTTPHCVQACLLHLQWSLARMHTCIRAPQLIATFIATAPAVQVEFGRWFWNTKALEGQHRQQQNTDRPDPAYLHSIAPMRG